MADSPSGRMPAKAPRWDLADTEGYGGGNCVSLAPWMFSGYRYVSNVSTFPNTFSLVLDSNLHDLNGTNPD